MPRLALRGMVGAGEEIAVSHRANAYVKKMINAPNPCGCKGACHGPQKLSAVEKAVLWYLADCHLETEGIAWPAVSTIALYSGDISERHAQRVLSGLICKGVIGKQTRVRNNGSNSSNGYFFPEIDGYKPQLSGEEHLPEKSPRKSSAKSSGNLFGEGDTHVTLGRHPRQGEGDTGVRGRVTPTSPQGDTQTTPEGDTHVTPLNHQKNLHIESSLESPKESKISPLPPSQAKGVKENPLPIVWPARKRLSHQRSWDLFKRELKEQLGSIPNYLDRKFPRVVADEYDFDGCFRDWWVEEFVEQLAGVEIRTGATIPANTRAGLEKYASRLRDLLRKHFGFDCCLRLDDFFIHGREPP